LFCSKICDIIIITVQHANVPLSGGILDDESDECGNEFFNGEELLRQWADSANPLILGTTGDFDTVGDLDASDAVAGD